jgi:hypothetical protein
MLEKKIFDWNAIYIYFSSISVFFIEFLSSAHLGHELLFHVSVNCLYFSVGNEKWLNAYHDPVASLYTLTQCIALSDIQADGDWKLVIADLGTGSYDMKLKVYKGNYPVSFISICPLSCLNFHHNSFI